MTLASFEESRLPANAFVKDVFNAVRDRTAANMDAGKKTIESSSVCIIITPNWGSFFDELINDLSPLSILPDIDHALAARCAGFGLAICSLAAQLEQSSPQTIDSHAANLQAIFNKHGMSDLWKRADTRAHEMACTTANEYAHRESPPPSPEDKIFSALLACSDSQNIMNNDQQQSFDVVQEILWEVEEQISRDGLPGSLVKKLEDNAKALANLRPF